MFALQKEIIGSTLIVCNIGDERSDNMKKYLVSWQDIVQRSVTIKAESEDEAMHKWELGNFDWTKVEQDDCTVDPEYTPIVEAISD